MEFLLFIIFFIFFGAFLALVSYYYRLLYFSDKDNFYRDELTDITGFLPAEILNFIESERDVTMGSIAFVLGILTSFLWSLFAALFGSSTYSNEFTTYFFLSCFIPLVFFFGAPLVEDYFAGTVGKDHPGTKLSGQTTGFVAGASLTVISLNLTLYGTYHELNFIFVLINVLSSGFVYIYRRREKLLDSQTTPEEYDNLEEEIEA